jgi:hypothetical protein
MHHHPELGANWATRLLTRKAELISTETAKLRTNFQ